MDSIHVIHVDVQIDCAQQWHLCRSPHLWKDPDTFTPERFSETNSNAAFEGRWAGYRPEAQGSSLYPNEVAADFAFIPFGGGARKCVGDQFALLEATVALSMLLRQVFSVLMACSENNLTQCAKPWVLSEPAILPNVWHRRRPTSIIRPHIFSLRKYSTEKLNAD